MTLMHTFLTFISGAIIVWITQQIISERERRKQIEETKLALYMSWIPFFAEVYASTAYPNTPSIISQDFLKKKMEILGVLQLIGPDEAIDAFRDFCDEAELAFKKDQNFDANAFHRKFSALNYELCCEIHKEARTKEEPKAC